MNANSHATHRLQVEHQTRAAEVPTSFGHYYPEGDILALADDRLTADRALQALHTAGMASDEVDIFDGPSFINAMQTIERGRGLLERIAAFVAVEEGMTISQYLSGAEAGNLVLVVHAAQADLVERVRATLAEYGVRLMRHYERFVIRDLYAAAI